MSHIMNKLFKEDKKMPKNDNNNDSEIEPDPIKRELSTLRKNLKPIDIPTMNLSKEEIEHQKQQADQAFHSMFRQDDIFKQIPKQETIHTDPLKREEEKVRKNLKPIDIPNMSKEEMEHQKQQADQAFHTIFRQGPYKSQEVLFSQLEREVFSNDYVFDYFSMLPFGFFRDKINERSVNETAQIPGFYIHSEVTNKWNGNLFLNYQYRGNDEKQHGTNHPDQKLVFEGTKHNTFFEKCFLELKKYMKEIIPDIEMKILMKDMFKMFLEESYNNLSKLNRIDVSNIKIEKGAETNNNQNDDSNKIQCPEIYAETGFGFNHYRGTPILIYTNYDFKIEYFPKHHPLDIDEKLKGYENRIRNQMPSTQNVAAYFRFIYDSYQDDLLVPNQYTRLRKRDRSHIPSGASNMFILPYENNVFLRPYAKNYLTGRILSELNFDSNLFRTQSGLLIDKFLNPALLYDYLDYCPKEKKISFLNNIYQYLIENPDSIDMEVELAGKEARNHEKRWREETNKNLTNVATSASEDIIEKLKHQGSSEIKQREKERVKELIQGNKATQKGGYRTRKNYKINKRNKSNKGNKYKGNKSKLH